jgi:hypothetical protein
MEKIQNYKQKLREFILQINQTRPIKTALDYRPKGWKNLGYDGKEGCISFLKAVKILINKTYLWGKFSTANADTTFEALLKLKLYAKHKTSP